MNDCPFRYLNCFSLKIPFFDEFNLDELCLEAVWPALTKFRQFGNYYKLFEDFYGSFVNFSNLLWQIIKIFGQILIVLHGQML